MKKSICPNDFVFLILIIYLSTVFLLTNISNSVAQTMTNGNYILQMGNLNSISGKPTGANYKLSFTSGQTPNNLFSGANYKVRAGFQYIYTLIPFSFSISNTFIDFGIISPTSPVTRTNDLTVSNGSAHGYQVTASQNHNLRANTSGFEIQPTTCDAGTCTTTTAAAWTSSLTYGFGYRCDNVTGTDCDSGFSTSTFYKQFVASPSAVSVMSSTNVGRSRKSTITYKVNVSGTQPAGLYTNIINYIAIPTF
jgi:hypothetical protein